MAARRFYGSVDDEDPLDRNVRRRISFDTPERPEPQPSTSRGTGVSDPGFASNLENTTKI